MKIALYARVSTDRCDVCNKKKAGHDKNTGHSFKGQNPEVQLSEMRTWCVANNHTVVVEYVDRISGAKFSRPQLDELVRCCIKGLRDIDAVIVQRLDRLGRSVLGLHELVKKLREAEVDFVSIKEGFDLTTSGGKALFGMMCVFAELERNLISERTISGMAQAKAEGHLPGPKIDPKRGPCRMTLWRRRQLGKSA